MSTVGIVLLVIILVVVGYTRAKGPWARYQALKEQDAMTEQGVITFQDSVMRHKQEEAQRLAAKASQPQQVVLILHQAQLRLEAFLERHISAYNHALQVNMSVQHGSEVGR